MGTANMHSKTLSPSQAAIKRGFDLFGAILGLALTWWLILLAWLAATIDTRSNGFFTQTRVGRGGCLFKVVKIKSMRAKASISTTVTQRGDPRITRLGAFLRSTKIDELPQLWNVLLGHMSLVGPRPDVLGFADHLDGDSRVLLSIRPGVTGPATLAYRNEEELLAQQDEPEVFNREVIWPEKVRINLEYIRNWSLGGDLKYVVKTVFNKC